MRLMLDSADAKSIPTSFNGQEPRLIAGYVDDPRVKQGRWTAADWDLIRRRFPNAVLVRICIWSDRYDADVIDIEPENNDAKKAVPWIKGKWARGKTPTVYCFSDAGPEGYRISDVRRECDAAGVQRPLFWITDWRREPSDFDPSGDSSIVALQYAGSAKTGGNFDASVVADHWPGVDPKEVPTTLPQLIDQSSDLTGANAVKVGQVCWLRVIFRYGDRNWTIVEKVIPRKLGRYVYTIYPWVDPDADPTRELSATPALFVIDVIE